MAGYRGRGAPWSVGPLSQPTPKRREPPEIGYKTLPSTGRMSAAKAAELRVSLSPAEPSGRASAIRRQCPWAVRGRAGAERKVQSA
ncbi:hypothetical protein GCM10017624_26740 [Azotobacter vinelandii]|nr:hypothetical protein GCM10017624_26740 [Azotobacter vinelandii]